MSIRRPLKPWRILAVVAASVLIGAACASTVNRYYDSAKPHHTPEGFRNNYPHPQKGSFWAWKWAQLQEGVPRTPEGGWKFDLAKADTEFLRTNNPHPSVTWIGHATVLVQIAGVNVLTDPQFSERASPVGFAGPKRVVPASPPLEELPRIDAVVISHDHYDHLDVATVQRLSKLPSGSPRFFVGLGLKPWFAELGITDVVEMDWWQSARFKGVEIHFVPVQHWSRRTLTDTNTRLWGGWVVKHPSFSFFFTGDAGYSQDFADIGKRFGEFDLAAIPIGAYAPRWFMQIMHVDPGEAVQVHKDVRARRSLGIHWGTFAGLTDEDLDEPPRVLAQKRAAAGLPEDAFFVLRHGETRRLEARGE